MRLNRMAKLGGYAAEFDNLSRYIEVITSIPWINRTDDSLDLSEAKQILDKNHYGMEEVKERILEYLATMKLLRVPILSIVASSLSPTFRNNFGSVVPECRGV